MDLRKISNCLKELARHDGTDPVAKYVKAHVLLGILRESNHDFLTGERDAGVGEVLKKVEMGFRGLCGFVTALLHDTENDYLHGALAELEEMLSSDGKSLTARPLHHPATLLHSGSASGKKPARSLAMMGSQGSFPIFKH